MTDEIVVIEESSYEPLQKNLVQLERSCTHPVFIFIFGAVAIATGVCYIVIASNSHMIWEGYTGQEFRLFRSLADVSLQTCGLYNIMLYFQQSSSGFGSLCLMTIIGGIVMSSLLVLVRFHPKISTNFGIFSMAGLTGLFFYALYLNFANLFHLIASEEQVYLEKDYYKFAYYKVQNILRIILIVTILFYCIEQSRVSTIIDIIKQSVRATFIFRFLILFGIVILIFNALIALVICSANNHGTPNAALLYTVIFGSAYLYLCIYYFGKMVISHAIATWHWSENKKEISRITFLRSIVTVCRYHLGAICFAATIILPLILAIVVVYRNTFHAAKNFGNRFVEILCKAFLIWNITDYALIITSVHGNDFFQATKRTFELVVKKSSLSLSVIYVFHTILLIGIVVIYSLVAILVQITKLISNTPIELPVVLHYDIKITINQTQVLAVFLLLPIYIIAETAFYTILLCSAEDDEYNEQNKERPSDIPLYEVIRGSS